MGGADASDGWGHLSGPDTEERPRKWPEYLPRSADQDGRRVAGASWLDAVGDLRSKRLVAHRYPEDHADVVGADVLAVDAPPLVACWGLAQVMGTPVVDALAAVPILVLQVVTLFPVVVTDILVVVVIVLIGVILFVMVLVIVMILRNGDASSKGEAE